MIGPRFEVHHCSISVSISEASPASADTSGCRSATETLVARTLSEVDRAVDAWRAELRPQSAAPGASLQAALPLPGSFRSPCLRSPESLPEEGGRGP